MATKPGIKTSEFWLALIAPLAAIVGVVCAAFGITVDTTQLVAFATAVASSALASHGYSASRATVKSATAVADTAGSSATAVVGTQGDLY